MRIRTLFCVLLCSALAAGLAVAADATGKWTAKVPGRDGQTRDATFTLKADGGKLTGTTTGRDGAEIPIADGKVDGNTISFTTKVQYGDNSVVLKYSGTVSGDEIKFKREGGQGQPREFTAKRAN